MDGIGPGHRARIFLPPVRHPGDSGTHVDTDGHDCKGAHEPGSLVQGSSTGQRRARQRGPRQGRHDGAVQLPDPDGGRHPDVQVDPGAGRARPEAACRNGSRYRAAFQSSLWGNLRAAGARNRRAHGRAEGPRRAQDVEELQQHDSAVRRREAPAQADHEDQDQ